MISNKMKTLVAGSSAIREMFEEGQRLSAIYGKENVFDFSIGNPSAIPPEEVRAVAIRILGEENPHLLHGYMNNSGFDDVREAIASHCNMEHQTKFTKENLVMTCGAAGGLNIILKALLNPGDEVVVLAPFFGEYSNYVDNYDGRLVVADTQKNTFLPDLAKLEAALTPQTKVLIINTPNNPTGAVYPAESLQAMSELLERKEREFGSSIYVVSDEPYREIVYDGVKQPFSLQYFRNGFLAYSYSKALSLPGERIGYVIANSYMDCFAEVLGALNVANRILGFVNAPSLFQRVVARTLCVKVDTEPYRQNRDILYEHLTSIGFSCRKPEGAFYLFPQILGEDEAHFIERAKSHNLLLVPGSAFHCPGHFRLSYCVDKATVQGSLAAFTRLAKEFIG